MKNAFAANRLVCVFLWENSDVFSRHHSCFCYWINFHVWYFHSALLHRSTLPKIKLCVQRNLFSPKWITRKHKQRIFRWFLPHHKSITIITVVENVPLHSTEQSQFSCFWGKQWRLLFCRRTMEIPAIPCWNLHHWRYAFLALLFSDFDPDFHEINIICDWKHSKGCFFFTHKPADRQANKH